MNKFKKSEQGFTLVELLATLAILSLVILLAGSVHIFGQKQFSEQTTQVSQVNDLRQIMASIERDVRQTPQEEIRFEEGLVIGDTKYSRNGNSLFKDSNTLSDQISQFDVAIDEDKLEISLVSSSRENKRNGELSTTIYFRR